MTVDESEVASLDALWCSQGDNSIT